MTEQEIAAKLNEKISNNELSPETNKCLNKIKTLQEKLEKQYEEMKKVNEEIIKIRGGISALIELAAENEKII
jgi:hypothetical protein